MKNKDQRPYLIYYTKKSLVMKKKANRQLKRIELHIKKNVKLKKRKTNEENKIK
jgi:hypothetical protein